MLRVVGHPHTHLDAGKCVRAEVLNDILQPVVPAGGATLADAQLAHRQGHIVRYDQHALGGYPVKAGGLAHCLTRQVHVGLRLHHQYFMPLILQHTCPRLEAQLIQSKFFLFRQTVQCQPAHIVAGRFVLGAGIAQPHQQPFHAAAAAVEEQGSRLLAIKNTGGLHTQSPYYSTVLPIWEYFN